MRQFIVTALITEPLDDVRRGEDGVADAVYDPDPDHYDASNTLARERKAAGARGLYYDSVPHAGGLCWPSLVQFSNQAASARLPRMTPYTTHPGTRTARSIIGAGPKYRESQLRLTIEPPQIPTRPLAKLKAQLKNHGCQCELQTLTPLPIVVPLSRLEKG